MVTKAEVIALLPKFRNKARLITQWQGIKDIINEIGNNHGKYETDYDKIYHLFDRGNVYDTCAELWDFCKYELVYTEEPGTEQTVKSPVGILQDEQRIDCKHYSLFIGGVLDAIKCNEHENWDWCYRFASYKADKKFGHVFIVVFNKGREIWVDPVLSRFDERKQPTYYKDFEPMALYEISGIGNSTTETVFVDVDKNEAEISFYAMVDKNEYGLRDLLLSDTNILYGPVKNWFDRNGFNFDVVLICLSNGKIAG